MCAGGRGLVTARNLAGFKGRVWALLAPRSRAPAPVLEVAQQELLVYASGQCRASAPAGLPHVTSVQAPPYSLGYILLGALNE